MAPEPSDTISPARAVASPPTGHSSASVATVKVVPGPLQKSPQPGIQPLAMRRFYAPELDCLRFVAFLAVFFFHAREYPLWEHLPFTMTVFIHTFEGAGSFGVDLFFVLSAYLITELLLREDAATGTIDIRAFYFRRILRIWPLYFFFIALMIVLTHIDPAQGFTAKYALGFSLLSGNWAIIFFGVPQGVAGPLWSISLEEQFYLCWPPLVKRLSTRRIAAAAVVMLLISNLSRLFLFAFAHPKNATLWFNTFTRLDPIALGILLAVLLRTHRIRLNNVDRILLLLAAADLVVSVSEHAHMNWNNAPVSVIALFGYPAVAIACFAVVLAVLGLNIPLVRQPALIYLGKISFGLYVFHSFSLWITDRFFASFPLPSFPMSHPFFALAFDIALAAVSYRFLETPFLRWKNAFTHIPSRPV